MQPAEDDGAAVGAKPGRQLVGAPREREVDGDADDLRDRVQRRRALQQVLVPVAHLPARRRRARQAGQRQRRRQHVLAEAGVDVLGVERVDEEDGARLGPGGTGRRQRGRDAHRIECHRLTVAEPEAVTRRQSANGRAWSANGRRTIGRRRGAWIGVGACASMARRARERSGGARRPLTMHLDGYKVTREHQGSHWWYRSRRELTLRQVRRAAGAVGHPGRRLALLDYGCAGGFDLRVPRRVRRRRGRGRRGRVRGRGQLGRGHGRRRRRRRAPDPPGAA